jgi:hypothetical protein
LAEQIQLTVTGESRFDGETYSPIEIFRGALQSLATGSQSRVGRIERIHAAGDGIGIE